jgi:hypothetical protein
MHPDAFAPPKIGIPVLTNSQGHAHRSKHAILDFDRPVRVEVAWSWQIHGYHRLNGGRAIVHYHYTVSWLDRFLDVVSNKQDRFLSACQIRVRAARIFMRAVKSSVLKGSSM